MSSIRACRDDERTTIFGIVNAAAEAYRGVIPDDFWHEPYMPLCELEREIAAGVALWGYEADGALVGVMGIQPVRDVDLIRHVYVVPDSQRHGVGGALLEHLRGFEHATDAGRHLGRCRMGDPLLSPSRLRAGFARTEDRAAQYVLDRPGPPDRDLGGAG
jgi:GNAT superfamily N-acetyltransferase